MDVENKWMKMHVVRKESQIQNNRPPLDCLLRVQSSVSESYLRSSGHIVFISFLLLWIFLLISDDLNPSVFCWTRCCRPLWARGCYLHGEVEDEADEEVKCSSSLPTSLPLALCRCFTPLCFRAAQWLSQGPLHQIMTPRSPPERRLERGAC